MNSHALVTIRTSPNPQCSVVIFPGAGGAAHSYSDWDNYLDPSLNVYAFEYAGHGRRASEAVIDDFNVVLREIVGALAPHLDLPLMLVGESMGGLYALEAAAKIAVKTKVYPQEIFVLSCSPVHQMRSEKLKRWLSLSDDDLVNELYGLGGLNQDLMQDDSWLDYFLPVIRADFRAVMNYSSNLKFPLDCRLTVLLGQEDPYCVVDEVPQWKGVVRSNPTVHTFSGGHSFALSHHQGICTLINAAHSSCIPPPLRPKIRNDDWPLE